MKDPYKFGFLGLENDVLEKEIETELTKHITDFLIELGKGFAFVGRQYHLKVSEKDYYIDLLFYHLDLRCYVVIELKAGIFKLSSPEAIKMKKGSVRLRLLPKSFYFYRLCL